MLTAAWVVVRTPGGATVMPRRTAKLTRFPFISSHRSREAAQAAVSKLRSQEGRQLTS
jgi:hypothetical protein